MLPVDHKGGMMWSWHEEQCANMILTGKFPVPDSRRAGGDCICEKCKRTYREHPVCIPYWDLNILCNGDHVHL